jgi:hypothetical protein
MSRDTTRFAKVHADRSWECSCGKKVWGNGGKSSHQRSCETYQQRTLDFLRRQLAGLAGKDFLQVTERDRRDRYRKRIEDHEAALAAILARQERRAGASPPKETP